MKRTRKMSWFKFWWILTYYISSISQISKIDLHLSKPKKNAEPNSFPKIYLFKTLKSKFFYQNYYKQKHLTEMLLIGAVFGISFHLWFTKMKVSVKAINLHIWNHFYLIPQNRQFLGFCFYQKIIKGRSSPL